MLLSLWGWPLLVPVDRLFLWGLVAAGGFWLR